MNFKMNNRNWKIQELSQEEIREIYKDYKYDGDPGIGKYFGITYLDKQLIIIDKDLHPEQKKATLLHELMHCFIGCYGFSSSQDTYSEEDLCNLSSNSHQVIHDILEEYFEKK